MLVQQGRDKAATKKVFPKLLNGLACAPRSIITDTLPSDGQATRETLPRVAHRRIGTSITRRTLPSPYPSAGMDHATVQVCRLGPARPLNPILSYIRPG